MTDPQTNLPARVLDHEVTALLSETKRSGPWMPGVNTLVKATVAEVHLDFREARLPDAHELCLDVEVLIGSVTVIVPPSWVVLQEVSLLVGSFEEDAEPVGPRPERVLRIIGRVRIGSVEVRRRLPGESWFGAKRRRWKLRRKATRALPPTS